MKDSCRRPLTPRRPPTGRRNWFYIFISRRRLPVILFFFTYASDDDDDAAAAAAAAASVDISYGNTVYTTMTTSYSTTGKLGSCATAHVRVRPPIEINPLRKMSSDPSAADVLITECAHAFYPSFCSKAKSAERNRFSLNTPIINIIIINSRELNIFFFLFFIRKNRNVTTFFVRSHRQQTVFSLSKITLNTYCCIYFSKTAITNV